MKLFLFLSFVDYIVVCIEIYTGRKRGLMMVMILSLPSLSIYIDYIFKIYIYICTCSFTSLFVCWWPSRLLG
ncbi:hypothetical protein HanRHA438_Chr04g0185651 [Helianthus annuus]|nr:hypothetical protein HanRHA438_Chr04g0185651 [Helianthus annuus]